MNPAELHEAVCKDDLPRARELLRDPEMRAKLNDRNGPFDSPLLFGVRSREMLDALLEAGADINTRSDWWAGGFGLLDFAPEDVAAFAIQRGALLDVHSAARLGLISELEKLLSAKPALMTARGGDGKTALHCARNVEIARFLVQRGADVNARDVDHESTSSQYHIGERQEIVRYLIECGCDSDIFIAAALGDLTLARKLIQEDPNSLRMRINHEHFPMSNPRAGGTIYQWTLGSNLSPHEVAAKFGHEEMVQLFVEQSPADIKLLVYCWLGDEKNARALLAKGAPAWGRGDERNLADAAREGNLAAIRLMLEAGLPADARGQHGGTPLHWAAWHGNLEMTRLLLSHNPPLEAIDHDFRATPLGWAMHGSQNGWARRQGNYPAVAEALLSAGARIPDRADGTPELRKILEQARSRP